MIPQKVKDHLEEYISQEVYVQVAIIKGKEKVSTITAIDKYFNTNHFRDFSEGKPYFHFIDGLRYLLGNRNRRVFFRKTNKRTRKKL